MLTTFSGTVGGQVRQVLLYKFLRLNIEFSMAKQNIISTVRLYIYEGESTENLKN